MPMASSYSSELTNELTNDTLWQRPRRCSDLKPACFTGVNKLLSTAQPLSSMKLPNWRMLKDEVFPHVTN